MTLLLRAGGRRGNEHLAGASEKHRRNFEAELLCGYQVDDEIEFGRLQDQQVGGLLAYPPGVDAAMAVGIGYTGSIAYHTTGRGEFAERIDCRHQDASILRSGLSSDVQAAIGQRLLAQHAQTEGPIFLKLRLLGTFCLLLSLLILIAAPAAHAVCRSPKNICKHISDCLARTSEPNNNDAVRIREGVRTRNGKMVWAGADACAVDLKIKRQWDKWSGGCADIEYVTIAKAEIELGKALCDRYSQ